MQALQPSIFDSTALFDVWAATLQFRDKVMAGTPKDPKSIEGWIRHKTGINDEEVLKQVTVRTLIELGYGTAETITEENLDEAVAKIAGEKHTVGFKRNRNGIYLESRTVKAMIKECVSILWPYQDRKFGATKKNGKAWIAERCFPIPETAIPFGQQDPDGRELFVGHVTGPTGRTSNLTYYEYVTQPVLQFVLMTNFKDHDFSYEEDWTKLWVHAQENGLGALRSQGYGRFNILRFEKLDRKEARAMLDANQELLASVQEEIRLLDENEVVVEAARMLR